MLWENLTSNDFLDAVKKANGVCAVPVGCVEKHGAHLPLGTDVIAAAAVAERAAEKEPVVVFPTMYFGEKSGAGEYPGTIIFGLETRWHIYRDTCLEIYRNGFKKILFCNVHGGNVAMLNMFARAMMEEKPDVMIFNCENVTTDHEDLQGVLDGDYSYLTEEDRAGLEDFIARKGIMGHGCLMETACVMHTRPETVKLDLIKAEDGASNGRFNDFGANGVQTHFCWMGNYPNSYSATTDYVINERIAKALFDYQAEKIAKIFKFLKEETISDAYHEEWKNKQKQF